MEAKCVCGDRPKVAVLMSSYNGKKYIEEQISSILNQDYPNMVLYVRDDGSSDGTAEILEAYAGEQRLKLLKGKNMGFILSFFQVMQECETADYYAWCDQDDVWMPDKISRAVERLEDDAKKHGKDVPVLYFSSYDYYDEQMNFQKHGLDYRRGPSFANSLMDCIALGFNSVFNHCARKRMEEHIPKQCCGHDWWTYMICAAFGRVLYDREYCAVKYRRLEQSVSPGGKNFIALQVWRFKKFFINDYFSKIRGQLQEFGKFYYEKLSQEDQQVMKLFLKRKYTLVYAVKKTVYPVWFRQGLVEELMVRVLFLTGRL